MTIRRLPPWALTLISIAPALLLLPFAKVVPSEGVLAWSLAATAWVLVIGCLAWRRMDETGRTAHRSAWFWGGSAGLFLALVSTFFIHTIPALADPLARFVDSWSAKHPPGEMGFIFGLLAAAIVQVIGYFIAWTLWWAKRR
jgi:Na+(H+)/acetate symporter ActP